MKKLCTIGGATQDIFIQYEGAETMHLHKKHEMTSYLLVEQGIKVDVPDMWYATGGGATNTACALVRLGLPVEAFFAVGDDRVGQTIVDFLMNEGVETSHYAVKKGFKTAVSFIIPSTEKNNVAFCYRGATRELVCEDFSDVEFSDFSFLYITSLAGRSRALLPSLIKKAHELGIPVASNPGIREIVHGDDVLESLHGIKILILNTLESTHLMRRLLEKGLSSPKKETLHTRFSSNGEPTLVKFFMSFEGEEISLFDYFTEVFKRGPSIVVVTNGKEGVYIGTPDKVYFHPSIKVEVVGALGAGDAFGSTFVGCLHLGKTLEEAIVLAVVNASS
ncbi:carbohydrate kinase family protein, partial [Candidatus Dependentiae bacterium]|nr:carbohydrate kinase family protein [Candidatus Dependentiae bacterium]